jgi:hypothetical protein
MSSKVPGSRDDDHHWMMVSVDPDEPPDDPEDQPNWVPAAVAAWRVACELDPESITAGHAPIYLVCKHCNEWRPIKDSADFDSFVG